MENVTIRENAQVGTLDWQMTQFQFDYPSSQQGSPLIRGLRSTVIEGYASKTSVHTGDFIDFMVSTSPASTFTIDVYRMGYYAGKGGRHMKQLGPFQGKEQRMPMETYERLRECDWEACVRLSIPDDWNSGVYLAKLTKKEDINAQSYIIFVVKSKRKSEVLVQVSDLTWQAYNRWPGVNSIYDDGTPEQWYQGGNVRVSFDRPYAKYSQIVDTPLSAGSGEYLLWEHPLTYWIESEGYDVTYCSNLDLHFEPELLLNADVFISVGHDEYWSRTMYENAVKARDAGVSLLFFSGNSLYHQVNPYPHSKTDVPFRNFSRKKLFQDERELMGSSSFGPGYGDWTVVNPDHWMFEHTGMKKGDSIPGLIGWEYHGAPFKEIDGLEIVAQGSMVGTGEDESIPDYGEPKKGDKLHAAVIYPGPKGNYVFNAGTIWWAEGLSHPPGHTPAIGTFGRVQGPDERVQQMTRNLLNGCIRS